ncbi:MAG: hypothetical protein JJ916_13760 [Phycisphaerales bacterium]|nr:hypothetical protein [Phycisphaerales bacterium]
MTVETRFEDYDDEELRGEAGTLERALRQRVQEELSELAPRQRPSETQAEAIASAFARFLVLRRTATREEYLERVVHTPSSGLTDENTQSAEQIWKYNSAWARHADIPVDSIRIEPVFVRGVPAGSFIPQGTRVTRQLGNGKALSPDTVSGHSVYKVLIDLTVPSVDASEEFDVTLGTLLINDGPRGKWSPIANEFIGVPQGKICFVPSP